MKSPQEWFYNIAVLAMNSLSYRTYAGDEIALIKMEPPLLLKLHKIIKAMMSHA